VVDLEVLAGGGTAAGSVARGVMAAGAEVARGVAAEVPLVAPKGVLPGRYRVGRVAERVAGEWLAESKEALRGVCTVGGMVGKTVGQTVGLTAGVTGVEKAAGTAAGRER